VDTVMVDGEILMQNHQFKTLDWDEVRKFAQSECEALLGRANWRCTVEEPKAGIMASLQLKAIQQSLKVMQVLVGAREPDQDETL
jgi:hypothetical protein